MTGRGPDPLGKQALYWRPVEARPTQGKRALYSLAPPEHAAAHSTPVGPLPDRGIFTVECSACGSVSKVGMVDFALLHLPFCAWLPRRPFDRFVRCPACRRRAWTSVTLSR